MRIVYVNFMDDKVLLDGVATDAVPPDHAIVRLPDENGWRSVILTEWRVVQRAGDPPGYYANVAWCFLTEEKVVRT